MKTLLRRGPWLTLFVALVAVGLGSRGAFELDRAAVVGGEWWRVVTGQLVHYGRAHAVGDILGFCGWAAFIEARSRRLLLGGLAASLAIIGPSILLFCPEVTHYRGLSGVDLALATIVLGVIGASPRVQRLRGGRALVGVAITAYVAKLAFELVAGHAILAPDLGHNVRLLPAAHVLGAIAGLATYLVWRRVRASAASTSVHNASFAQNPPSPGRAGRTNRSPGSGARQMLRTSPAFPGGPRCVSCWSVRSSKRTWRSATWRRRWKRRGTRPSWPRSPGSTTRRESRMRLSGSAQT